MLDSLMGNMEEFQAQLKEQLSNTEIVAEAGDGAVKVTVNGLRELTNVNLAPQLFEDGDPEQLEDLLLVAINRALEEAAETEANASKEMMKNMLPPGLGQFSGLFGG